MKKLASFKQNPVFILSAMLIMLLALASVSFAATADMQAANITVNYPSSDTFNASINNDSIRLNATVRWSVEKATNITNVTWYFTAGSTTYSFNNATINGTAAPGTARGDFIFTVSPQNLTANTAFTVKVEIKNSTDVGNDGAVNSSSFTFTLDSNNPGLTLNNPTNGETVIPSDGLLSFFYTPSDTNLANATLYVNGARDSRATSNGIGPNATNSAVNVLKSRYAASGSTTWRIELTDLAGNKFNSTARTLNVVLASEGGSPIVGSGSSASGGVFVGPKAFGLQNRPSFLERNLVWIILGGIAIFIYKGRRKR